MKHKLLIPCLLNGLGFVSLSQPNKVIIEASNEEFANLMMEYSNEIIIDVRDTAFYNNQLIHEEIPKYKSSHDKKEFSNTNRGRHECRERDKHLPGFRRIVGQIPN